MLYCIDANTGNVLWTQESIGSRSELTYLNGILYYICGPDLLAVEGETGKRLWKITSPDVHVNSAAWFQGVCIAVPGTNINKGVVIATTGLHAYAFEAIQ